MSKQGLKLTKRGKKVSKKKKVNLFYDGYSHFINGQISHNFDYRDMYLSTGYESYPL